MRDRIVQIAVKVYTALISKSSLRRAEGEGGFRSPTPTRCRAYGHRRKRGAAPHVEQPSRPGRAEPPLFAVAIACEWREPRWRSISLGDAYNQVAPQGVSERRNIGEEFRAILAAAVCVLFVVEI